MRKPIEFFATGLPKGQPRPRAFSRGGKAHVYDPATAEGWKSDIATAAKEHTPEKPWDCAMAVRLSFKMPRPQSHFGSGKNADKLKYNAPAFYGKKPDADNLAKAVLDALTQLGFWKDDCLVCRLIVEKEYTANATGCEIAIREIEE